MVILIDKCIKFVWMITVITRAWLAYVISESFSKNLSVATFKLSYAKIKQEPADFDSLIWQLRLALLSHFTCPENERPNLRSRRLLVVFHAKANSLALAIFKQRIPISGWFYISTVTTVSVDTRLWENKIPTETFPKFPSVLCVIDRSDRNPPITATSVTFWPSLRHASGLWLVDFDPICRLTEILETFRREVAYQRKRW